MVKQTFRCRNPAGCGSLYLSSHEWELQFLGGGLQGRNDYATYLSKPDPSKSFGMFCVMRKSASGVTFHRFCPLYEGAEEFQRGCLEVCGAEVGVFLPPCEGEESAAE